MIQRIKDLIEQIIAELELMAWKASDENREMVRERLRQHDEAMAKGELGPYFSE